MTLDADGARARAASRAREGESVALRKCLLADGDALEAVFDAAARARVRGVRVSGCLGRLRAPELARAIARGVRAGESGWLEELSAAETPARGEKEEDAFALKNEFMNIISNELQLTARNGAREPYPLKSKVAQITAEFIKREGSVAWIAFSETVARMLRSVDAYECELGAIIAKYVAEDVALHSDEVFADKVRDLLGGMTQTIGEVTGAMREAWEKHFSTNNNNNNNSNSNNTSPEMQKASENCALAVLEAVSVYAEWAPLVPLVRSGLVDVCCMALLVRFFFLFTLCSFMPMMIRIFWINHPNIHREDIFTKTYMLEATVFIAPARISFSLSLLCAARARHCLASSLHARSGR